MGGEATHRASGPARQDASARASGRWQHMPCINTRHTMSQYRMHHPGACCPAPCRFLTGTTRREAAPEPENTSGGA